MPWGWGCHVTALSGAPWPPVNYRGSTGFGQDSILSLPGNVGHQDVKDVQVAGLEGRLAGTWLHSAWRGLASHTPLPIVCSGAGAPGGTL